MLQADISSEDLIKAFFQHVLNGASRPLGEITDFSGASNFKSVDHHMYMDWFGFREHLIDPSLMIVNQPKKSKQQ